jgi:adenosylmethionine---8-amino-7-oxononanoate aminotransferase
VLLKRSRAAVWHPCTQMKHHESLPLVPIGRAQGSWLYDPDGRRYLDAISSWWVNLFGHGDPRIIDALTRQLHELEHVMLAGFTHSPVVELSERLSRLTAEKLGHCFYASDGASATEIALKMSFHYWRNHGKPEKTRFVSLEGGYHGETIGALGVTDVPLFKSTYEPLVRASSQVPAPDSRKATAGESAADVAMRCGDALERYLNAHHESIAAFIIEPLIQGAAGMVMYDAAYLRHAREICLRYEVHLIADEIMTGFGRTGTFFAHEQGGIVPDFLCLSKGITGGYLPLSVVMTTPEVYDAFYDEALTRGFLHSHSYTGNPLACRAALAVLDIFEADRVIEANRTKAAAMNARFAALASHPRVANFRNTGMVWAFEVRDEDANIGRRIYESALARELLLRPIGNTVYFMPPYTLSDDEQQLLADRTLEIIGSL